MITMLRQKRNMGECLCKRYHIIHFSPLYKDLYIVYLEPEDLWVRVGMNPTG